MTPDHDPETFSYLSEKVLTWLLSLSLAISAFFGRRFFKRIDMLSDRLDHLEKTGVTKDQCDRNRDDSSLRIGGLEQKIDRQAERIDKKLDEHYRDLTKLIIGLGDRK